MKACTGKMRDSSVNKNKSRYAMMTTLIIKESSSRETGGGIDAELEAMRDFPMRVEKDVAFEQLVYVI